jgi:hypothetical protein
MILLVLEELVQPWRELFAFLCFDDIGFYNENAHAGISFSAMFGWHSAATHIAEDLMGHRWKPDDRMGAAQRTAFQPRPRNLHHKTR